MPAAPPNPSEQALAEAAQLHGSGRIVEAIAAYRELVAQLPGRAELHYRLGVALCGRREFPEAATHLAQAAELEPLQAAAWAELALARRELGEFDSALAAAERARALNPAMAQVNARLGSVLLALGRIPEALERFEEEVSRFPREARSHEELGVALLAAGLPDRAADAFVAALRLDRDRARAHAGLAVIFFGRGEMATAEIGLRQVLRLAPDDAPALSSLGQILAMYRVEEAERFLRRATELDADDLVAARTLGYVLRRLNRVEESREVARTILSRHPDDLQAAVILNLGLAPIPAAGAALAAEREQYREGLDTLLAGRDRFAADPSQVLTLKWENFTLAYRGGDDRPLQEKYATFVSGLARLAVPQFFGQRPPRRLAPGERIRVGFVSSFLHQCTVGKYFRSWFAELDRSRFEVFVYYTGFASDEYVTSMSRTAEHYRRIGELYQRPIRIAEAVLADRLDVLVYPDVGMDTASYLLAGMRLAPVQCAGWGHPVTTGQPGIDYFLTCGEMEPDGAESHYSERLVRLPGLGTRYARPAGQSDKSRGDLGLPEAGTAYLCPQSLFKIHPDNDSLFASVLARDPAGRLVFFRDNDRPLTAIFRDRLFAAMQAQGVDGPARTVFLERMKHPDYLRVNALCDVMLDTLHWSGGNTTLDAIASGLPPVTLPGPFMRGRQSRGMLRILGLEELVAKDADDYAALAVRLATDRARREEVSAKLRDRAGRLFDRREPVVALEDFLQGLSGRDGE